MASQIFAPGYRRPLHTFRWQDIETLLIDTFDEWSRQKAQRLGAALAFYTLLSITPLMLVVVSVAGLVFGAKTAESHLVRQIQDLAGPAGAMAIQALLEGARKTPQGVAGTIAGICTLLFGASGVLIELRDALNTIWEVPAPSQTKLQTIREMIRERLFSFALVLSIGFLLLVSLAVNAAIAAVGAYYAGMLPVPEPVLHVLNIIVSFVIMIFLFGAIYKVVPDVDLEWHDVVIGAAVTALLFNLGKLLIGLYLGKASFASTYGAAATIVVFIVWVYYSSQIFFFGAEFTKVFAKRHGSRPQPHPDLGNIRANPTSLESSEISHSRTQFS